jgi:hypothetical protein
MNSMRTRLFAVCAMVAIAAGGWIVSAQQASSPSPTAAAGTVVVYKSPT